MDRDKLSGFIRIFKSREKTLIEGRGKRNFLIVTILFFVTFFAVAYALKGITELKDRMDNPFTNWVSLDNPYGKRDKVLELQTDFEQQASLKDSFHLKELTGFSLFYQKFYDEDTKKFRECYGRTINFNEELCKSVLSSENKTEYVLSKDQWNECGLIVTRQLLKLLGIQQSSKNSALLIKLSINSGEQIREAADVPSPKEILLWIPVFAVVNNLPQNAEFLLSTTLKNCLVLKFSDTKFVQLGTNFFGIITRDKALTEEELKLFSDIGMEDHESEKEMSAYHGTYIRNNIFLGKNSYNQESLDSVIATLFYNSKNILGRFEKQECVRGFDELKTPEYLSFYFNKLTKVRELKRYLKDKYSLELDMSAVEDKENFSSVSTLTYVTTIILFIIGLGCLSLFTWFFLKNHLENSRKNLGTLTAFGLNSDTITSIYTKMINEFMLKACLTAISCIIVIVVVIYFITDKIIGNFWNYKFIIAVLIALGLNILISRKSIHNILANTPGNLIYGRS